MNECCVGKIISKMGLSNGQDNILLSSSYQEMLSQVEKRFSGKWIQNILAIHLEGIDQDFIDLFFILKNHCKKWESLD